MTLLSEILHQVFVISSVQRGYQDRFKDGHNKNETESYFHLPFTMHQILRTAFSRVQHNIRPVSGG